MDKEVTKHLEFIQNNITRMGTNSFLIKNWSMIIVTLGLTFMLGFQKTLDLKYVGILIIILLPFWMLDAYFLSMERRYRDLYDVTRDKKSTDFSMDLDPNIKPNSGIWNSFFSKTLVFFYLSLVLVVFTIFWIGKYYG